MKNILIAIVIALISFPVFAGKNYDSGIRYYTAKNYDKARELLLKEIEEVPTNGNAYYFLGELEKTLGNFGESEGYFRKAVQTQIQRKYMSLAFWNIIVLVEQRNDIGDLIKICRDFNRKTGDNGAKKKIDDIINKLIWSDNNDAVKLYREGLDLSDAGKKDEARKRFADALRLDSSFLAPRFEIGFSFYKEKKNADALPYLKAVGDAIPYYSAVHLLLGDLYYSGKSYQQAAAEYDLSLEYGFFDKDTRFSTLVKSAGSYYNIKRYDKAAALAKEALAIEPNDKDTLMMLSAISIKTENYNDALDTLSKLSVVSPNDPDIMYQIGSLYYKQGRIDKAASSFESLFAVTSKEGPVPSKFHKAMTILIKHYEDKGEHQKALKIAASISDSSAEPDTKLFMARAYYNSRDYNKAAELYEKLSLADDDRLNLARSYVKLGDKARAKSILLPVMQKNQTLRNNALSDPVLSPVAKELQQEEVKVPVQGPSAVSAPAGTR